MTTIEIPFVKHVGIEQSEKGYLELEPLEHIKNHVDTIHASAQFMLAETQSGLYLQTLFPEYIGHVVPLLRGSTIKYKNPATTTLTAHATVDGGVKEKFISLFERKGRGSISVCIELKDEDDLVTMTGEFYWFVQKLD